jgi:hypothetical protein
MRKIALAAAAAFAVVSTAALATVTFDPSTGTGFVGKGDVQLAFGWNNAAAQNNAGKVTFTYNVSASYDAVCTWVTGEGTRGEKTHNVTHKTSSSVISGVQYDARAHKQVDGFILRGFGATIDSGDPVPVVGGACQGEGAGGTWSSVTPTGTSGGGLYVNYGGNSVLLLPAV